MLYPGFEAARSICLLSAAQAGNLVLQNHLLLSNTGDTCLCIKTASCSDTYTHTGRRGTGASERELEALAIYMGHSLTMQRGVYDR